MVGMEPAARGAKGKAHAKASRAATDVTPPRSAFLSDEGTVPASCTGLCWGVNGPARQVVGTGPGTR